jgi:sarcosine oxidase, subunit gamma
LQNPWCSTRKELVVTAEVLNRAGPLKRLTEGFAQLPETVQIVPKHFVTMIDLRVDPGGAAAADVGGYLGVDLPATPSIWAETDTVRVIWLGPDEWLVTSPFQTPQALESGLRAAVEGRGAVVDVSAQRTTLWLAGKHARDVLSSGCSVDLHPRVFKRGSATQALLGLTSVVLIALDDIGTSYHILVRASFAQYLATWLLDAALEHSAADEVAADERSDIDLLPAEGHS